MPTATMDPTTQVSQKAPERVNRNTPGLMNDGREKDLETEQNLGARTFIPEVFENAWNPITSGVGSVATEASSAMADLLNIARGAETTLVNPTQGSIENFNQPRGEQLNPEAAVAEARRIFQETKERQAHFESINASIDQVTQLKAVEEDARFELNIMPDDQFAEKADYKNTSFRAALKTVANRVYVFGKLIAEKLQLIKERAAPLQILSKRTSSKGAASGAGDLLMNATAQEGQSAIANAVRGSG